MAGLRPVNILFGYGRTNYSALVKNITLTLGSTSSSGTTRMYHVGTKESNVPPVQFRTSGKTSRRTNKQSYKKDTHQVSKNSSKKVIRSYRVKNGAEREFAGKKEPLVRIAPERMSDIKRLSKVEVIRQKREIRKRRAEESKKSSIPNVVSREINWKTRHAVEENIADDEDVDTEYYDDTGDLMEYYEDLYKRRDSFDGYSYGESGSSYAGPCRCPDCIAPRSGVSYKSHKWSDEDVVNYTH